MDSDAGERGLVKGPAHFVPQILVFLNKKNYFFQIDISPRVFGVGCSDFGRLLGNPNSFISGVFCDRGTSLEGYPSA